MLSGSGLYFRLFLVHLWVTAQFEQMENKGNAFFDVLKDHFSWINNYFVQIIRVCSFLAIINFCKKYFSERIQPQAFDVWCCFMGFRLRRLVPLKLKFSNF